MKAKYNLQLLHEHCLKWCEKPVFPYPWQDKYTLECSPRFSISDGLGNQVAEISFEFRTGFDSFICRFAHLIGINVEDYRIRETYKTAVERYLSTIKEDAPLWEGSGLLKKTPLLSPPMIYASLNSTVPRRVLLINDTWTDDEEFDGEWGVTYHLLRLNENPDYKID